MPARGTGGLGVGGRVQWSPGEEAGSAIGVWAAERGMDERGARWRPWCSGIAG